MPDSNSDRPVVLVTGAAKRLGQAISLQLAAEGWDVALHYGTSHLEAYRTADQIASTGVRSVVLKADLADEKACKDLLPSAVEALGRVNAVVNNASLFDYDDANTAMHNSMDLHWKINTAAPVILAQALAVHCRQRGHGEGGDSQGCVVNLLDQKLWNPNPDYFSYTLSKAALKEATTLLAQGLAPFVRVCGVAPGLTLGNSILSGDSLKNEQIRCSPHRYALSSSDIAKAVSYCLNSPGINGSILMLDAGQRLLPQPRDFGRH